MKSILKSKGLLAAVLAFSAFAAQAGTTVVMSGGSGNYLPQPPALVDQSRPTGVQIVVGSEGPLITLFSFRGNQQAIAFFRQAVVNQIPALNQVNVVTPNGTVNLGAAVSAAVASPTSANIATALNATILGLQQNPTNTSLQELARTLYDAYTSIGSSS